MAVPNSGTRASAGPSLTARELFRRPEIDVVPGAGTPLEARLIAAAGFAAIYVSGYAHAAAIYGKPDIGLVGAAETIANVAAIRQVVDLPLIVDADTGYGDVVNVRDTVRRLEQAGADAIQIEDQVWPKRCGHLAGKRVISRDDMLRKVAAAAQGRRSDDTVIIARTDARRPLGFEEALERAQSFAAAGADAVFIDAPESVGELERIGAEVGAPTVANMSETGLTPLLGARKLQDFGFSIALFPTSLLRVATRAGERMLEHLRATGDTSAWLPDMMSLDELNALVGLDGLTAFEDSVSAVAST
jgi:2-methylisocitrate lyase-like PEP mutase family enzyme